MFFHENYKVNKLLRFLPSIQITFYKKNYLF